MSAGRKIKTGSVHWCTPRVINWFENNWPSSVALEIKITGGKLKDHQHKALIQVQKGAFEYKIVDTGRRNPFDAFILKKAHAFLVVCKKTTCTVIPYNKNISPFVIHI